MRALILGALFWVLAHGLPANQPPHRQAKQLVNQPRTFFFDGLTKGFTISRVTTDDNQAAQTQPAGGYQVRFVPLISVLAGLFPSLLNRLGQFTGVNKVTTVNNRRFPVADPTHDNSITAPPSQASQDEPEDEEEEEEDDDYLEKELIECDGHHLGLWPDKTDSQRYYKCEVDPRTATSKACVREMMGQDTGKEMQLLERVEVPGVKPCYLLSMLKCANGFKYQHSSKICVPDIVYGSKH